MMNRCRILLTIIVKELLIPLCIAMSIGTAFFFFFHVTVDGNDFSGYAAYRYTILQILMVFPIVTIFEFMATKVPALICLHYKRRFTIIFGLILTYLLTLMASMFFLNSGFGLLFTDGHLMKYLLPGYLIILSIILYIINIIYTFYHGKSILGYTLIGLPCIAIFVVTYFGLYSSFNSFNLLIIGLIGTLLLTTSVYLKGYKLPINR